MTQQEFFKRYTYNVSTDKLGGGAFGTVYKAYDNTLDKYVAIKIAEVKEIGGKKFSLLDEFEALKGLAVHQNIANYEDVYTFQQQNGVFDYAVIQYYPHGNLKSLQENNNLSATEIEAIATELLQGIEYLHNNNVIHRDLKPSNILVHRRNNGKYIPKIADFGLSKKTSTDRMTNSFAGGTVEFSSPEQLKGQKIKKNSDLWSFGVIAYELFTGNRLFQSNSSSIEQNQELIQQIFDKDITSKLNDARIPENWKTILKKCLQQDSNVRAESATELLAILNQQDSVVSNDETVIQTVVQEKPKQQKVAKPVQNIKKEVKPKKAKSGLPKFVFPLIVVAVLATGGLLLKNILKPLDPKIEVDTEEIVGGEELSFSPQEVLQNKYGNQYRLATKADFNWSMEDVESVLEMQKVDKDYPFVARGDFNNDGKEDYVYFIKQNGNNENKLLIYSPEYDYTFIPNLSIVRGFDAISVEAKSNLLNPKTGLFINLLSDAVLLDDFAGEDHLMYWDGTKYRIENMGL